MLRFLWKLTPRRAKEAVTRFVRTHAEPPTAEAEARLAQQLRDLETRQTQLEGVLRFEHGFVPIPPKHLQIRVEGQYTPDFIAHGYSLADQIFRHVAAATGKPPPAFGTILDYGCGCGRVARAVKRMAGPSAVQHGIDIDAEAVKWANDFQPGVAEFRTAPAWPPTTYTDGLFDLVYGISVFTHLPEDMQFAWLGELARVTKPGGVLALTTHGETFLAVRPAWKEDPAALARGFVYRASGGTAGLPDFYQDTYHSHEYIRREWGKWFEVLAIVPAGLDGWQDVVILRKPAG